MYNKYNGVYQDYLFIKWGKYKKVAENGVFENFQKFFFNFKGGKNYKFYK